MSDANAESNGDITILLGEACRGDQRARSDLWEAVYDELRAIASRQMASERPDNTLQPTALVHEAYVRLLGGERVAPKDRAYFFASAARAMSRILIERARRRNDAKRGQGTDALEQLIGTNPENPDSRLDALENALEELSQTDSEVHEVVLLRFFAGLDVEGTADALDISTRSVKRKWAYGRAWLYMQMSKTTT
jgi:RNA polymerase sigma factor (TIGR02999 family)